MKFNKDDNITYIYHDNCRDGITAAAIALQQHLLPDGSLPRNIQVKGGIHGKELNIRQFANRHVVLLDFSYKLDAINNMLTLAKSVTVLDHHISAFNELRDLKHPNFEFIYDADKCGAQIAWREFIGGPEPMFVKLIGDRDLWTKKYTESDILNLALLTEEYTVDKMIPLVTRVIEQTTRGKYSLDKPLNRMIERGTNYKVHHDKVVKSIASRAWVDELEDGTPVMKVNCPPDFCSAVGEYLYTNSPVPIAWMFSINQFGQSNSMRVGPSCDFDAATYAKTHGGGGHKKAAGWGS